MRFCSVPNYVISRLRGDELLAFQLKRRMGVSRVKLTGEDLDGGFSLLIVPSLRIGLVANSYN